MAKVMGRMFMPRWILASSLLSFLFQAANLRRFTRPATGERERIMLVQRSMAAGCCVILYFDVSLAAICLYLIFISTSQAASKPSLIWMRCVESCVFTCIIGEQIIGSCKLNSSLCAHDAQCKAVAIAKVCIDKHTQIHFFTNQTSVARSEPDPT